MLSADSDVGTIKNTKVAGAERLAAGKLPKATKEVFRMIRQDTADIKQQAADLVKVHGLTSAEIAAIRVYSDSDYRYINPAVAGLKSWMEDNIKAAGSDTTNPLHGAKTGQAAMEGGLHGEMAKWGLSKLPSFDGKKKPVFRGETRAPDDLRRFRPGKTISFAGFASTSSEMKVSTDFLLTELRRDNTKVGVLHKMYGTKGGKDISAMSVNAHEHEVLFPPGLKVKVTKFRKRAGTAADPHIVESHR